LAEKQLNDAKKHLIAVLEWNKNLKDAGCDDIDYLIEQVNIFSESIDEVILFLNEKL
jgi:hypothetical protein